MEEIVVGSIGEVSGPDDEVTINKVNREFHQESKLKGVVREFTIFNDIYCIQMVKKKHGKEQKFRVNLTYLNPEPQRIFILAKRWLLTAFFSIGLSAVIIYLGWFSNLQIDQSLLWILTSLIVSFSFIAFLITSLRTSNKIILYSRHGHAPILELLNKNPDRESFFDFINELQKTIVNAQQRSQLKATDQLTLELKELRRLKDEKMLVEKEYEKAKKNIFGNSAFR